MGTISVAEAAKRLGVGVARVHHRIADGSLPAERIGSQWVIDEALLPSILESSRSGRPLSERSAWALLAFSRDDVHRPQWTRSVEQIPMFTAPADADGQS